MENTARTIKGLNIANIVLSILLILAGISLLVSCIALSAAADVLGAEVAHEIILEDDIVSDDVTNDIDTILDAQGIDAIDDILGNDFDSADSLTTLAGIGFIAGTIVGVVGITLAIMQLIAAIFMLITAILSLKNCNNPAKLKAPFVMAIISACFSFICGGIPTLVLFIISAVFIGKARTAYKESQEASCGCGAAPVAPALESAE